MAVLIYIKYQMRLSIFLGGLLIAFSLQKACCQANESTGKFMLQGSVAGKHSGAVILYYADISNKWQADTVIIKEGKFTFTGTVNLACEAMLWTDTGNHVFDNPYMIRLLLQPGIITIDYTAGNLQQAVIEGAPAQKEKMEWEKVEATLLLQKEQFRSQNQPAKYDSVNAALRTLDLNYIKKHPASYYSGNLLSRHKRRLPIDTIQYYYGLLEENIRKSNLGFDVLTYVYPLTTDTVFRNKYPAFGDDYNTQLKTIRSVHQVSIPDTSGKMIHLAQFKGRYILLDFWASWCAPCLQDLPYLEEAIKKFRAYPIEFIAVSLDTDAKKWKDAIRKNHPSALQVADMKAFYGILPVFCKVITGVPQYVLIDKEGAVINNDLPQPDDKALETILDNLLKKKN
jgi:thiol-disulfide isomerase/thioredoxin